MNGESVVGKEVGELIEQVHSDEGAKGCGAHEHLVNCSIKGLRLAEQSYILMSKAVYLLLFLIASFWLDKLGLLDFISGAVKAVN